MNPESRLREIAAELATWRALWQEQAFCSLRLAWEREWPALSAWLRALPLEESARLHADEGACLHALSAWLPVERWQQLAWCEQAGPRVLRPWPRGFTRDVPGRKWQQVEAFVAALEPTPGLRLVEWCAGKGHLARALVEQWRSAEVVALERDEALLAQCEQLALRSALVVRAEQCDVMSSTADRWLTHATHVVALHACGHLHLRLLHGAIAQGTRALSLAPCCYHLGGAAACAPQSRAGAACWPGLHAADLRTSVQETVTAEASVRRRRQRLQEWQLGFDLLARELRGVDEYLPLPAVGAALLAGDFAGFCRELARRKGLVLPARCDFSAWERAGQRRFAEVSALDLVRHRFRRLLELWLVHDRARLLQEHDYAVRVQVFCPRSLSPRNLLLHARRAD